MSYTPPPSAGSFNTACYDLSQHIHAAGYSTTLAVIALAVPDCPASLRLDLVASQALKRSISQAIRSCIRPEDGLYEIEQWEWVCVLPSLPGEPAAHFAMQKFKRVTEELYAGLGIPGLTPITFGLAFLHGGGDEARELIQSARIAQNAAREAGRTTAIYERWMEGDSSVAQQIDGELRAALASNDGIELLLQPVVELASGRWTSAEVAISLKSTAGRVFSEDEVVQSVVRQGLLAAYLRWLFNAVARLRGELLVAGIDLPLALNLSCRDLEDDELPEMLCQILALHDCPPEQLILELSTGNTRGSFAGAVRETLLRLAATGFRLSLDDFGIGHGDLAALQDLPFGEIKLSPELVQGVLDDSGRGQAMIAALAHLGHSMAVRVVAQGVDSAAVETILRPCQGLHLQGGYVSPALDAEGFIAACAASAALD